MQKLLGEGTALNLIVLVLLFVLIHRTWSLEWDKLTTQRDSRETSASNVLLGLCVELFMKGLISTALELTAGLGPCQESWRYMR